MMKNILLVSPCSEKNRIEQEIFLSPPLGVVRLAGFLREKGHNAQYLDINLHKITQEGPSFKDTLLEEKWDIIGFSVLEETLVQDLINIIVASKIVPNALLIAGGIEAQFNYQTILDKTPCKIVILGEGEIPLQMIADGKPLHEIPGIVIRNNLLALDQETFNEATNSISWEDLPYEKYWKFYEKKYGKNITEEQKKTVYTVRIFSRNRCPIGCKFCSSTNQLTWGAEDNVPVLGVTEDTLVSVVDRVIKSQPKVRTIYFTDDDFCINKMQVIRYCKAIIDKKYPKKISFLAFSRISDLNEEVLTWLKKANWRQLNVGVESFSQRVLDEMNKKVNENDIDKILMLAKKIGIEIYFNIILVTPKTILEDIEINILNTLKYIKDKSFHAGIIMAIKPLKGTEFFESYSDYASRIKHIGDTNYQVKIDDMILADDKYVREVQLEYYNNVALVLELASRQFVHHTDISYIKLVYTKRLIDTIRFKYKLEPSSISKKLDKIIPNDLINNILPKSPINNTFDDHSNKSNKTESEDEMTWRRVGWGF